MLPPEPRGRVPRGFLKNVDFPLDRTEGSSYNTTVRDVSRTTSYPGVAQLVARMVRDHEAVSSNLATRTMQSVLIGSEYPVMDTLLFYFLKSSYCKAFRGVADSYVLSRIHDNVGLRDIPAIRHIESADAVVVDHDTLIGNAVLLFGVVHLNMVDQLCDHALCNGGCVCVSPHCFKEIVKSQELCYSIARALAVEPEVLLMDESTSALDPISTSKIEDLACELKDRYTVVMVTHNMQQAARISDNTAFFLLGELVEFGKTEQVFSTPADKRTEDYITGRFG